MDILCKMLVFKGSRISIDFDIFRYVLIFLTYFGHNLGTNRRADAANIFVANSTLTPAALFAITIFSIVKL